MIKVVFLDFDGVVNSCAHEWHTVDVEGFIGGAPHNPFLINNLNMLLNNTDAKLVISSTWRLGTEIDVLQKICDALGINGEVIGKTISLGKYSVRGNEILAYIKDNQEQLGYDYYYNYKSYVIIDDDCDMLYPQRNNFVHVDNEVGFTDQDAQRALEILL